MYKFREIKSEKELKQFMQLRYETYLESVNRDFIKEDKNRLDIDVYDLHSKHFGLFYNEEPIGSVRLVMHKSKVYDKRAYNIGLKNGKFKEQYHNHKNILKSDYPEFPFISNTEIPSSVAKFYSKFSKNKKNLLEASRLTLVEKFKGLSQVKFLIESTIVYFMVQNENNHAVLNCNSSHERFYNRYGFKTINTKDKYFLKGRTSTSSSVLSLSSVEDKYQEQFQQMAYEYKSSKTITRAI